MPLRNRFPLLIVTVAAAAMASASVHAAPILGSAADFAILGLDGGGITINSATSITGNVGYSANVTSTTNQKVDSFSGTAYVHSTATFSHTSASYAPSGGIVSGGSADSKLDQANADALAAASFFAGLTVPAANALGAIGDDQNVDVTSAAPGSTNVFSIASLKHKSDTFTIHGGTTDVFVFNVAGDFDYDQSQIILDGVLADNVYFNFLSDDALITIGKDTTVFAGTILAPGANSFVDYHNPATFNGRIIAREMTLHSDFNLSGPTPGVPVPEPGTLAIVCIGLAGLGLARTRKRPA